MTEINEKIQSAAAHQERGELEEAEKVYTAVLEEVPDHPDASHLLGVLHHQRGDHKRAIELILKAIKVQPENAGYLYNLGVVHQAVGDYEPAVTCFRQSLALNSQMVSAWVNLGNIQQRLGQFTDSYDCCRNTIRLEPDVAQHYLRAGTVLRMMGSTEAALAHFGRSLDLDPDSPVAISGLLLASQYQDGIDLAELSARHGYWAKRLAALPVDAGTVAQSPAADSGQEAAKDKAAGQVLTLGFVSPDLGNHPVGIFLAPLLERLKADAGVRTICYSDRVEMDEFAQRNQEAADGWHDVNTWSNSKLAGQVREDGVDVLFDLTGHTEDNRLRMFCERPAKVQITWAGYVGSTGIEAIDYILTDQYHTPPELEEHYTEKPLRMPADYIPYEAPDYAPEITPLPLLRNGYPTFGCLNNPSKISAASIRLWSRLLHSHENSRMIFKYKGMDDPAVQTRVRGLFSLHGISGDRIDLLPQTNHVEHLACYGDIDIALDPLTYSSGLTTCESLWMGVPVVTLPGDRFATRHSLSHLQNVGIKGSIAENEDDYLHVVEILIGDPDGLNAFRQELRAQMAASPLCDLDAYTRDFLQVISGLV